MDQNSINSSQGSAQEQIPVPANPQGQIPVPAQVQQPVQQSYAQQQYAQQQPVQQPYAQQPYAQQQPVQQQPKKKSKKPLAIFALIAVIALGTGGFFLYRHFSKDDTSSQSGSGIAGKKQENIIDITDYDAAPSEEQAEELVIPDAPEKNILTHLSLSRDDNGDFQRLSGSFDNKVSSEKDALAFISEHAGEIGVSDPAKELRFLEKRSYEGTDYYVFSQIENDVLVSGNELIVAVNAEGSIDSLSGRFTPLEIQTTPAKTKEEAESIAKAYIGDSEDTDILSNKLFIMPHTETGSAQLVYEIRVLGKEKSAALILSAETGDIISENKLTSAITETLDVEVNKRVYRVDLEKTGDATFDVYDPNRNITVSDAGRNTMFGITITKGMAGGMNPLSAVVSGMNSDGSVNLALYPKAGLENLPEYNNPAHMLDTLLLLDPKMTEYAVGSLNSIQNAYDYYDKKLGWKSFDGNGMPIKILVAPQSVLNEHPNFDGNPIEFAKALGALIPNLFKEQMGAAFIQNTNLICVGHVNDQPLVGHGILGHEFTHAVINKIAHISNTNMPSKTIDEGYADVMGAVITCDWEFFDHELPQNIENRKYILRNPVDPNANHNPAFKGQLRYYIDKPTDEHQNATLVSHSAYLMYQNGLTFDEIGKVFFKSIHNLSSEPDFEIAANAVIDAAKSSSFSEEKIKIITAAFLKTKMLEPDAVLKLEVHSGSHIIPFAQVTLNGKSLGKTDKDGILYINLKTQGQKFSDPDDFYNAQLTVKAEGFNDLTQSISLLSDEEFLDCNLSPGKDFGKVHGSDPEKKGSVTGEKVTVTIYAMSVAEGGEKAKQTAQDYYVQKGSKIDLRKLVESLNKCGVPGAGEVTTDGTTIYFDSGFLPVELSYRVYDTGETFDFNKPIYEDVVLEPITSVGGFDIGGEDLGDLAQEFDEMFNGGGLKKKFDESFNSN